MVGWPARSLSGEIPGPLSSTHQRTTNVGTQNVRAKSPFVLRGGGGSGNSEGGGGGKIVSGTLSLTPENSVERSHYETHVALTTNLSVALRSCATSFS